MSYSLRVSRKCTLRGFSYGMEQLHNRLDQAIATLEKVYLEVSDAMAAHSLEPVLEFKERLEQADDKFIQCKAAVDKLIKDNPDYGEESTKDYMPVCKQLEEKTFEMMLNIGRRISLFESRSSRGSSRSSRSSFKISRKNPKIESREDLKLASHEDPKLASHKNNSVIDEVEITVEIIG